MNSGIDTVLVDKAMIRGIFTMRLRRWPDGTPIRVFVLPDWHPAHRRFAKQVLGVFPHQLRRAWDRQAFSGTGQAPTEVADDAGMPDRVISTSGAIGYLSNWAGGMRVHTIILE